MSQQRRPPPVSRQTLPPRLALAFAAELAAITRLPRCCSRCRSSPRWSFKADPQEPIPAESRLPVQARCSESNPSSCCAATWVMRPRGRELPILIIPIPYCCSFLHHCRYATPTTGPFSIRSTPHGEIQWKESTPDSSQLVAGVTPASSQTRSRH